MVAAGSFELNPPFSIELYTALIARCLALLDVAADADKPLSFALVIGATQQARKKTSHMYAC